MPPRGPLPWDIYEEHFDEATFLWRQWTRARQSPALTAAELAEGTEARLLAHLDGLVLGGYGVSETLLLPALRSADPFRQAVAVHCLLVAEAGDYTGPVMSALERAEGAPHRTLAVAAALARRPELEARLIRLFEKGPAAAKTGALVALLARGDEAPAVATCLEAASSSAPPSDAASFDDDRLVTQLEAAAVRPASYVLTALVEEGLHRTTSEAREAALFAAAWSGGREAMSAAWKAAFTWAEQALAAPAAEATGAEAPSRASLRLALALLTLAEPAGTTSETGELVRAVALRAPSAARRADAAWALGFHGTCANAAACLSALEDPAGYVAAWALDSFALITGLPTEGAFVRPAPESAAGDDDLRWQPERLLPAPAPAAVFAWWRDRAATFAAGARWLRGQPLTHDVPTTRRAFDDLPLVRERVFELELTLRAGSGHVGRPRPPRWGKAHGSFSARFRTLAFDQPLLSFFTL